MVTRIVLLVTVSLIVPVCCLNGAEAHSPLLSVTEVVDTDERSIDRGPLLGEHVLNVDRKERTLDSSNVWDVALEAVRDCFLNARGICYDDVQITGYSKEYCAHKWYTPYENLSEWKQAVEDTMGTIADDNSKHIFAVQLAEAKPPDVQPYTKAIGEQWSEEIGGDVSVFNYLRCSTAEFFLFSGTIKQVQSLLSRQGVKLAFPLLPELKTAANLLVMEDQHNSDLVHLPKDGMIELRLFLAPSRSSSRPRSHSIAKQWNERLDFHLPSIKNHVKTSDYQEHVFGSMKTEEQSQQPSRGRVLLHSDRMLSVQMHASLVPKGRNLMSAEPEAYYFEARPSFKLHNLDANLIMQSGYVANFDDPRSKEAAQTPFWEAGLRGEGQVVGVADSGLDTDSCFFRDSTQNLSTRKPLLQYSYASHRKVRQYVAYVDGEEGGVGGHGTHVCGSIAGEVEEDDETEDLALYSGVAPRAKLAFFDIGEFGSDKVYPPASLDKELYPFAYKVGARVHTNSWGGTDNAYTSDAREVDSFAFDNQDFLVIFAAGNGGQSAPGTQGRVATPATAKSCLTVGASSNSDRSYRSWGSECPEGLERPCERNLASFSANGPTSDGRIKPEVVAPGQYIGSAKSGEECEVVFVQGTSMAAPLVAGAAALARQYLVDGFYPSGRREAGHGFEPMAALLKAILVNSGQYLKGTYAGTPLESEPSLAQGFGLVRLDTVLLLQDTKVATARGLPVQEGSDRRNLLLMGDARAMPTLREDGQEDTYRLHVRGGSGHALKVTLVWNDAPASELSSANLVNDLDLSLETELEDGGTGALILPVLPGAVAGRDRTNVVEQIELKRESSVVQAGADQLLEQGGWVRIKVRAHRIAEGPQPYALVVNGGFEVEGAVLYRNDGSQVSLYDRVPESQGPDTLSVALISIGTFFITVLGIKGGFYAADKYDESLQDEKRELNAPQSPGHRGSNGSTKRSSRDSKSSFVSQISGKVRASVSSAMSQASKHSPRPKTVMNRVTSFRSSTSGNKGESFNHAVPRGWQVGIDSSTGRVYYLHQESGNVSWTRPTGGELPAEHGASFASISNKGTRAEPRRKSFVNPSGPPSRGRKSSVKLGSRLNRKASGTVGSVRASRLGNTDSSWTKNYSPAIAKSSGKAIAHKTNLQADGAGKASAGRTAKPALKPVKAVGPDAKKTLRRTRRGDQTSVDGRINVTLVAEPSPQRKKKAASNTGKGNNSQSKPGVKKKVKVKKSSSGTVRSSTVSKARDKVLTRQLTVEDL